MTSETQPRLIAFYLPQFHPIPENDEWWGKGFTEWTSVTRARPLFPGHQQPRLPADLGFYDLRLPEVREAQAALARLYGIDGFCYYYYWFKDGVQLLERPLREMLDGGAPDFPFCLCWANEPWTRRWSDRERDVLVAQDHSPANNLAFIRSIVPYLKDPRYIRVEGRPLLLVYRAALIPGLAATVLAWREELARHGLPPPYLVAAETYGHSGAEAVAAGFDAGYEFPPHGAPRSAQVMPQAIGLGPEFTGGVRDYARIAAGFRARALPDYPLHRGLMLAWDNTARRGNAADISVNFTVEAYHGWLRAMLQSTREAFAGERRILFVNAWNEWSEGSYLEPDQLYGHACLEATRAALLDEPWIPHVAAGPEPAVAGQLPPAAVRAGRSDGGAQESGGDLRIVSVSMIGNEADIVEAFVRDNLAYVDHMLIAEHNTLDGTRDILQALVAEGLPLTVTRIETAAFDQAGVTNALLAQAVGRFDPDWVIPLDADEFLDAESRDALEAELTALGGSHARLRWIQHVPTTQDDPAEAHPARRIRHRYAFAPPNPAQNPYVWKLALNGRLIRPYLDRYDLEKGSHRVVFRGCREPSAQPATILRHAVLRHYPVRSFEQLSLKAGLGMLQGRLAGRNELGGTHVPRLYRQLLAGRHDLADLQRSVREYLDSGRRDPDELADTAIIAEAKQHTSSLCHGGLRQPATVVFLRWIERQGTAAADPGVTADAARGTQATRFDWCPWLFWGEASAEARAQQMAFQAQWVAQDRLRCGARCYVSPQAGLAPTRVTLGDDCYIAARAYVTDEVTAGSHCTINPFAVVRGRVHMGDHVRVGAHASILGFNHNHARLDRPIHEQGLSSKGIRIGDDVWLGSGALLLDGITIGSHCIVAAGAVVTRDVPDWAVVAGNPARVLRDRRERASAATRRPSLARTLADFGRRAAGQWPGILARSEVRTGEEIGYTDIPGTRPASIRPLADAIEIAAAFGGLPPGQSAPALIARLQACQDPGTGMPMDPLAPPCAGYLAAEMNDGNAAYMVLSLGYALMCLDARFPRPFAVPQEMSPPQLQALLAKRPWTSNAWGAGAWVDAVGTALWMNRHFFGLPGPADTLFAWLQGACNPQTGLWGEPRAQDGWLEPVNGFYRLTRGTYAQFDRPVPYPEAALDTILAHIRANDGFETRNVNAFNLLDVVHPLWLLSQSSAHRRDEVLAFIERQLPLIAARWVDGAGFAFAPGRPPGLQGTEMWLSILRIGADALELGDELPWTPRGVHRLRPPEAGHD